MIEIQRPEGSWSIVQPRRKLAVRYALPGAHGYDRGTQAMRRLVGQGGDVDDLLVLAMPASWMVNNKATSPVFMAWLQPRLLRHWQMLLKALAGRDVHTWPELPDYRRQAIAAHVQALCVEGQGVAAVSKVLAQLCPDLVPLMDDAAIAFLTGAVTMPDRADKPSAGPEHFLPTLDAFAAAARANDDALGQLATEVDPPAMSSAQILDRLLWMESWGYRLFGRGKNSWWWVVDDAVPRQAILTLDDAPHPTAQPHQPTPLSTFTDDALRQQATETLSS